MVRFAVWLREPELAVIVTVEFPVMTWFRAEEDEALLLVSPL